MFKDYYRVMGVEPQATQEEIKKAYRVLAKEYHPDTNNSDPGKEDLFKEVSEAYHVLGDSELRRRYDVMCSPYRMGGMAGPDLTEDTLTDLLRAIFEGGRGMRGMGCRGRGFGRRGCGRKF